MKIFQVHVDSYSILADIYVVGSVYALCVCI